MTARERLETLRRRRDYLSVILAEEPRSDRSWDAAEHASLCWVLDLLEPEVAGNVIVVRLAPGEAGELRGVLAALLDAVDEARLRG